MTTITTLEELEALPVGTVIRTEEHGRLWSRESDGLWCRELDSGKKLWHAAQLAEYLPAELIELGDPAPAHGSPEWHMAEAELHLRAADKLAKSAETDPGAADRATRRLLAASANANLATLKLQLQADTMMGEMRRDLRELADRSRQMPWPG